MGHIQVTLVSQNIFASQASEHMDKCTTSLSPHVPESWIQELVPSVSRPREELRCLPRAGVCLPASHFGFSGNYAVKRGSKSQGASYEAKHTYKWSLFSWCRFQTTHRLWVIIGPPTCTNQSVTTLLRNSQLKQPYTITKHKQSRSHIAFKKSRQTDRHTDRFRQKHCRENSGRESAESIWVSWPLATG